MLKGSTVVACSLTLSLASLTAQSPDLMVASFDRTALVGDWQSLELTGSLTARIANVGSANASQPFDVTFFEDTNQNGAFDPLVDRVFGTTTIPSLAASTGTDATVAVAADVRFRDDLIWAFCDSGAAIAESDETNNLLDTGRGCFISPAPGVLQPVQEWHWSGSPGDPVPTSLNVMNTPCVIDLDGDGFPEIVFGSTPSTGGGLVEVGHLRALDGRTGAMQFTVSDPAYLVNTACSMATGDLDNDGRPEIVACDSTGSRLIAFEHDGTFKWRSGSLELIGWGAPSLADIDEDGDVEIVVGRQVLDHLGNLLWTGTAGRGGASGVGPISCVADIDQDGMPEIVAGNTLYSNTGAIEWQAPVGDAVPGVANFDADAFGEIVLVASGQIHLIDHDGSVLWGPVAMPGGGYGGPPTIADYDGDGLPEIGVAGATRYAVFEHDGTLKWAATTQDGSSNRTGSSVFDFQGDGAAEVVYRDERFLRVYDGSTGNVLWSVAMSSCTWHEYVLVADVDADGNAEIVAVANNNCGFGPERGVYVFGAAQDNWVATRQIWNQHSYHITNINDDGSIPQSENDNWLTPGASPFNNFRQNVLTTADPRSAPDLTASRILPPCVGLDQITVRVGNGGQLFTPAGVSVAFYDGDPNGAGTLLGTAVTTSVLQPGDFEDVSWTVPGGTSIAGPIFATVDDDGTGAGAITECDETNNEHSQGLCGTRANWVNYGTGHPGTGGVPALTLSGMPQLGAQIDLQIGNAQRVAAPTCVFIGRNRANLPTPFGGSILVAMLGEAAISVPAGGLNIPISVPCDPLACGEVFTIQAIELDPGASAGIAFSQGLEITLGN